MIDVVSALTWSRVADLRKSTILESSNKVQRGVPGVRLRASPRRAMPTHTKTWCVCVSESTRGDPGWQKLRERALSGDFPERSMLETGPGAPAPTSSGLPSVAGAKLGPSPSRSRPCVAELGQVWIEFGRCWEKSAQAAPSSANFRRTWPIPSRV